MDDDRFRRRDRRPRFDRLFRFRRIDDGRRCCRGDQIVDRQAAEHAEAHQKDEDDDNIINVDGIGSFDIDEENFIEEDNDYYMDYGSDYTQEELDDMYRAAFEGDPDAQWNID